MSTPTVEKSLGQICDRANAEADAAFDALFSSNPNNRDASRSAWEKLHAAYETLRLALLTAGHPAVADMSGSAVHGYAELHGPFS